jgi:hypothetical protein
MKLIISIKKVNNICSKYVCFYLRLLDGDLWSSGYSLRNYVLPGEKYSLNVNNLYINSGFNLNKKTFSIT